MLNPDQAAPNPNTPIDYLRVTMNADGSCKVEGVIKLGSLVVTIADHADIRKEAVK